MGSETSGSTNSLLGASGIVGSDSLANTVVVTSIGFWLSIDESSSEEFLSRSVLQVNRSTFALIS
jgi:hypothetical protein